MNSLFYFYINSEIKVTVKFCYNKSRLNEINTSNLIINILYKPYKRSSRQQFNHLNHVMKTVLHQVLLFSFFILLIAGSYSSFTSLLNFIHKAHGEEHIWHAQAFFIINSISCIFFNILIPNLKITNLKKFSYSIPISFLMIYVLTYLGFLTMNSTGNLILTGFAAIFSGIGSSAIWIISGKYIRFTC